MTEQKILEPAQSEWELPTIFARKKDETLPFCALYTKLKALANRDWYSTSHIDKFIDVLGGHRYSLYRLITVDSSK